MDLVGMRLLASVHLGAGFTSGEGMAVVASRTGRRALFVAAEHAPCDFVVVDVTDPRQPVVRASREIPVGVRSNNLAVRGEILAVTRQNANAGEKPAGVEFFDIADPFAPASIGFFDASGGASLGTHFVWLADDGYAYLASGAPDYTPRDRRDRFFLRILDAAAPTKAVEVGRFVLPGLAEEDGAVAPERPAQRLARALGVDLEPGAERERHVEIDGVSAWDFGFRVHNITVQPEDPERAYLAYTSGGAYILDIADRSRPAPIGHLAYGPPFSCSAHTFVPLTPGPFALLSDETLNDGAIDQPMGAWVVSTAVPSQPTIGAALTLPWPPGGTVGETGRFGPHNLHEYAPGQAAWRDPTLVFGAFFGLGIGVYDLSNPLQPIEVGRFVPGDAEGGSGQINDIYADDRGIVYAVDRRSDLCFILELSH